MAMSLQTMRPTRSKSLVHPKTALFAAFCACIVGMFPAPEVELYRTAGLQHGSEHAMLTGHMTL